MPFDSDEIGPGFEDVFGKGISDGTANRIDIASHYPYNPERLRVFVDGTRQLIQYGAISQYNHAGPVHELIPGEGETVSMETTERPRYVVQYEAEYTTAFRLSRSLETGETFRWGPWDGTDGWYFEQTGADADTEGTLVVERGGNQVLTTEVELVQPTTAFTRFSSRTAWYRTTRQVWSQSFPEDGEQQNIEIGRTGEVDVDGPNVGNVPLRYEITRAAGSDPLTLEAGSLAMVVLGDTEALTRDKTVFGEATIDVSNEWVPVEAFRVDPDRFITNVEVEGFALRETNTSADTFLLFNLFDPSNVLDSGGNELTDADFGVDPETNPTNSVIERSTAVDQVADDSGVAQTSMPNPGGYQLRASAVYTGTGLSASAEAAAEAVTKRSMNDRDIGVVLAFSSSTGAISYNIRFEQDW